ncbi:hypothetical protein K457DRAFT_125865 [Linnemannia elongata AG-77]|uniref:Uncharacterized protein n=1 Tax=Linnemannia elongata AG-77 TaxID=1314771 RepID=A0A197JYS4_9FUNG|nr:hypothetical protein K457DRAFT_125865 [Linnemannia elongata AG-77]
MVEVGHGLAHVLGINTLWRVVSLIAQHKDRPQLTGIPSGRVNKVLLYSHRRQCTVAASWKNVYVDPYFCDCYEPEPYDKALTDCNNQDMIDMIMIIDNTIEYDEGTSESSNLMTLELTYGCTRDVSQGKSKLFQQHTRHGVAESRTDAPLNTLTSKHVLAFL